MRTVVGLYQHFEDAQKAILALGEQGFRKEEITLIARDARGEYMRRLESDKGESKQNLADGAAAGAGIGALLGGIGGLLIGLGALTIPGIGPIIAAGPIAAALAGAGIGAVAGGLIGALVDLGIPEDQAKVYVEAVRRGGTLLIVRTEDERADQAVEIMNRFNPEDIDKKAEDWASTQLDETMIDEQITSSRTGQPSAVPVTGEDITLPVVEEDLDIKKHEIDRGGARVRTYVHEEPIAKDVFLRQENINIERRPLNEEFAGIENEAFQEWSMEYQEVREDPVIDKRSQVVEEVHVYKDIEEKQETIQDTVRRQEVEIERIDQTEDWRSFDSDFRQHFQNTLGSSGKKFNEFLPAYRYGYDLAHDPRYENSAWEQVEPEARQEWERRGSPTPWNDVKYAVRYAWSAVKR